MGAATKGDDMKRTLILGAGFGGISVAMELRRRLGEEHEVVLVDRNEHFMMGLRKLWAVIGLGTLEEGRRSRELLVGAGVRFLQREIRAIEPAARRVITDREALDGDYLVVALGAEPRPDLVPGLAQHAHDLYDVTATPALAAALAGFEGGRIAIVIAGVPYKCPPAPYECALLIDAHLRERATLDRAGITVTTLQPMLLPNAGRDGSVWLGEQLEARGIVFQTARKVERVEAGRVVFTDGELEADLLIGVPPHLPPRVVKESGLTGNGEWVRVDPGTLETGAERVFAIGDNTQITLANGLPLPKAGIFAELEGARVAAAIAADVRGDKPPAPFDGRGYCFLEMGPHEATIVEGDFFAQPEPRISLREVSQENHAEKERFESERLRSWFGS